jgi:hypothetical protein
MSGSQKNGTGIIVNSNPDDSIWNQNEEIMENVMDNVFSQFTSPFNGLLDSIEKKAGTTWGEGKKWYRSGKYMHTYASINVKHLLRLHEMINHSPEAADEDTVSWVEDRISANEEDKIRTPPLVLEPSKFVKSGWCSVQAKENQYLYLPVQDGRSRPKGAYEAGMERIPVLLSVRRPAR